MTKENKISNGVKKIYNKLVRDKIPGIIKKDGFQPEIKILKQKEFIKALFDKLKEEVKELFRARGNKKKLIKEIGDIYEVIDCIIKNCGLNKKEIIKLKQKRKIIRGGFDKKIFLKNVENCK